MKQRLYRTCLTIYVWGTLILFGICMACKFGDCNSFCQSFLFGHWWRTWFSHQSFSFIMQFFFGFVFSFNTPIFIKIQIQDKVLRILLLAIRGRPFYHAISLTVNSNTINFSWREPFDPSYFRSKYSIVIELLDYIWVDFWYMKL